MVRRCLHHVLKMVARRFFKPAQGEGVMVNRLAKTIKKEKREDADEAASHVRH